MPCGRWGGKGAGWEVCTVSDSVTEDDGGLSLGDERGMQSRENCRNPGTERLRSDLVMMLPTNTGA